TPMSTSSSTGNASAAVTRSVSTTGRTRRWWRTAVCTKVSEPGSHSRTTWPTVGRGVTAGMLGPMPAAISVIVPARDAGDGIDALCDALAAQTLARERFEVVVVDDGSRDATA